MVKEKNVTIYLATMEPDGSEHHMKWEGHENLESAKKELSTMMEMAMKLYMDTGDKNYLPRSAYTYEADAPLYGHKEEELDFAALQNYVEGNF